MSVVELADHEVSCVRREVAVCSIPHKMSVTELYEEMFRNLPRRYSHRDPDRSVSLRETHIVTYANIEESSTEKNGRNDCYLFLS